MAPAILQFGCTIQCPHGGQATPTPTNTRVKVDGAFALFGARDISLCGQNFRRETF